MEKTIEAIILVSCPDQRGIVARLASAIHETGGNILDASQHTAESTSTFLQRIHVSWEDERTTEISVQSALRPLVAELDLDLHIRWGNTPRKVAVFVSHEDHCLHDLLLLQRDGALHCLIALIVSNHKKLEPIATQFGIPFHHVPVEKSCDSKVEADQIKLLTDNNIDLVILARYMRVLSESFTKRFSGRIINIHHSFLPAFAGGKPYHQAFMKGVKLIGATAHYATAELDEGPIIEQGVIRVSHKDHVEDMVRKGRDIERTVLARAVRWHLEDRLIVHANRAIVFE
jgi:formyltetrahydrofolate deformylase